MQGGEAAKAVIYARYSSDSQREGYTILSSYIDRALSARTADRPEFQRMIRDSEKGLFDTVLVWELDRFSRDRYDSAHYKHILKKNGIKVVSAKENISDGPEGIILEYLVSARRLQRCNLRAFFAHSSFLSFSAMMVIAK
ncbi:MAG: recombinase family protein [Oscillospiraceae bacterium]|nr:recombinase family protein [Oscillospiraceae bacterium]